MDTHLESLIPKPDPLKFIKVLTILTFIGCAYVAYNSFQAFFNSEKMLSDMEKGMAKMEDAGQEGMFMDAMKKAHAAMEIRDENKTVFFIVEMLGIGLCLYGAIMMRQAKSIGYYLWLTGEIVPILLTYILIGGPAFNIMFYFGLIFPFAFIIMYSTQLKKLQ
jgi:hypothetical protein